MNTKRLDRPARKLAKRQARLRLKALYASMTREERDKLLQIKESKPNTGMKKFITDLRQQAAAKS